MNRKIVLAGVGLVNLLVACGGVNYNCTLNPEGFCVFQGIRIGSADEANAVDFSAPGYDMKKIKFRESTVIVLPDKFYSTFPQMQELRVWWQGLHSIYIPSNLLHLDAEKNRINTISFNMSAVPLLKKLELGHNRLKTIENISHFENLEILDLSHNDLRSIDLCLFQRMRKLRTLDLSVNNMAILKNSMEEKLESLTVLYLNDNRLSYLDINVLKLFPNLETLHLFNNGLMYMEFENMRSMFHKINIVHIYGNDWNCENLAEMILYFNKTNIKDYKLYNALKCKERVINGICCSEGKALTILKKSNLYFSSYVNELNLHSQHIMQEMKQSKREIQKLIEHENMTQASLRAFSDDMSAIRSRIENITLQGMDNPTPTSRQRKHEKVDKLVQEIYKIKQDYQSLTRENQIFKQQIEGYEKMKSEMDSIRAYSEEMKIFIKQLKEENSLLKGELYQLHHDFNELKISKSEKEV
ncbi:leucine-rich repeat-containing protein 49-like [Toxorhynchites rutilus septentrionalis]|uniref:leucine-rich repeat-containing protein 49-like n=1 Tax=Toxorhynchites rutilus septentrionalis TaxID=329112 RepID=UPI00247991FA|nr:leucine-rich repeat-containing protein 49-like [Toxorhynchites rutilus septentrionalis]